MPAMADATPTSWVRFLDDTEGMSSGLIGPRAAFLSRSADNRSVHDDVPEGSGPKTLVVDDAPEFRELVGSVLRREGFRVETAADGDEALVLARASEPDVVVLDIGLPGIDGVEVCRQLRTFSDAYVVMVTGRQEEVDKLIGLSVGADDYVTKPFSPRELVARIRAMLRRPRGATPAAGRPPPRRLDGLELDPAAREVRVDGTLVELTRIEFDLLDALSERPRVALTRAQLLEQVWGPSWFGDDHVVDVHVSKLRQKLGDDPRRPRYLSTVRGVGYRLDAESR
jgi:DNA-binding response OmpR family regulator